MLKWPEFLFDDNDTSFHKKSIQGEWAGIFHASFRNSCLPFCSAVCPPWLPDTDRINAPPCPSGTGWIQLTRGTRTPAGEKRMQLRHPFPQYLLSGTQIIFSPPVRSQLLEGDWSYSHLLLLGNRSLPLPFWSLLLPRCRSTFLILPTLLSFQ